ncbi:Ferredoxin [Pseudooceanicola batsensis HTCC2597]|uniref:Ferredoxin n=1 Tax=Pseudooceanicola batsensis (strain ATCC BAA-863 / DSM 15984 / KCTC 12145 / HTCC2597) TaxID=252305 RepID=A3TSR3_PSEBH|nr:(2Fe-2S)-binding protein [Pseudooceanicola batsensis]EAQ04690.1 Ferredoxin [Pseudooceanicola batsensis HTCC2597]
MELEINGETVALPDRLQHAPLLDVIRDHLGLKGTKFGCGAGLCGACTIHVDGVATRSCQMTPASVAGASVRTIEGLAGKDRLHPVQRAWMAERVPQCGYCQPGQIMTAAAFIQEVPQPSDAEIRQAMQGNLCRCGTYPRIRAAVARAAREARHD